MPEIDPSVSKYFFSDANFFNKFDIPLSNGSREKALERKNSIVIDQELVRKFFDDEDRCSIKVLLRISSDDVV